MRDSLLRRDMLENMELVNVQLVILKPTYYSMLNRG